MKDDQIGFRWQCGKGHPVAASFTTEGIEELEQDLARGEVSLYCIHCDENYRMGPEVQANIKKWLALSAAGGRPEKTR